MTSPHTEVQSEWVRLQVDNSPMEAYVSRPAKGEGPWPGILVFMEIFGVNSHICSVTDRLAVEGYVTIAINYYHRSTPNLELGYSEESIAEGRRNKDQTTREGLLADIQATMSYLSSRPDVAPKNGFGCIGFCFGGHVAYIAATLPEIIATASFYGGGIANMSPGGGEPTISHTPEIKGKILCLFGAQDPLISHEETVAIEQALNKAETQHEVVRYHQTGHGFFCDQRADYNATAAQDAWSRVKALFHHIPKSGQSQKNKAGT